MQGIIDYISNLWESFKDWAIDFFLGGILSGIISILELIPVPDWLQSGTLANIPSGVAYFAQPLNLEFGVSVILSAYLIRFLIRRIPFVG